MANIPAFGSFHFMQIEQVVGGVHGDRTAQAVQLRMRSNGQNLVHVARILAWDAQGMNPVLLVDLDVDLSGDQLGDRVLVASESMVKHTTPGVVPDFVMTNLIPESYLAAGSITFENDEGSFLVWRFSWGGASYTGDTTGALTNEDDGEFGPPFPQPLPSTGLQTVQFQGAADALGSANADDYELTPDAAALVNNAGQSFTLVDINCPNDPDNDADGDNICGDVDNCPDVANADQADGDGDGIGDACDSCPNDAANDADEDSLCGDEDNCPEAANEDQSDLDGDGVGDVCDNCPENPSNDVDRDGICAEDDNCPQTPNANQADRDGDGIGDVCDACPDDADNDADGDGICGNVDNCPEDANPDQADADGDEFGDACDGCPNDPARSEPGPSGCASDGDTGNENSNSNSTNSNGNSGTGNDNQNSNSGGGGNDNSNSTPRGCGFGAGMSTIISSMIGLFLIRARRRQTGA